MEGWLRGLKHRTANAAIVKAIRGFESLTFRKVHGKVIWYELPSGERTTNHREVGGKQSGIRTGNDIQQKDGNGNVKAI